MRLTVAGAEGAIESAIDRFGTTFADVVTNVAALLTRAAADGTEASIGPRGTPHTSRGGACFARRWQADGSPLEGAIDAAVCCEPEGNTSYTLQWRLRVSKAAFPPEVVSGMLQMYGSSTVCERW